MRTRLLAALALIWLPGCRDSTPPAPPDGDRITQVSVVGALMVGQFDGVMPIDELLRLGDLGVGTLDHLDGELVVLDGKAFQVRGDGAVVEVGPDRSTPFATVVRFEPDGEIPCPRAGSLADLDDRLDRAIHSGNAFVAVRVDARFASITLRSVPRQEPPYRPLAEAARDQTVWTHPDVEGTLVGIRSPAWAGRLNVPGFHWHFVSSDRTLGGHVLDCQIDEGLARYDVRREWVVKLPDSPAFGVADLAGDFGDELERVERARGPARGSPESR